MIEFLWAWVFIALPLPIVFLLWKRRSQTIDKERALLSPLFQQWQQVTPQQQNRASWLSPHLTLPFLIWVFLILAAANPAWLGEPVTLPTQGRDIMIAVDVSGSMKEADITLNGQQTTRLNVVKSVLADFIERREGDRLGLILFGEQAYLQCPLTFDRSTVATFLDEAAIGIAGRNATAIGDSVGMAIKRYQKREESNRILVLLTDGESNAGVDPVEAAHLAAESQIKIYTIGIGAEAVQVNDMFFGPRMVNPSKDLDEKTLRAIAEITGAQYFRGRNQKELEAIYQELDALEPIDQEDRTYQPKHPLFMYPLTMALLLLIIAFIKPLVSQVLYKNEVTEP
ncbi:MAG: VWA domain-containing protein [Pseudomonadota bacterium]